MILTYEHQLKTDEEMIYLLRNSFDEFSHIMENNPSLIKPSLVLEILKEGHHFKDITGTFQKDLIIAKSSIILNAENIKYLSDEFKNNHDIITLTLESDGTLIRFLPRNIRENENYAKIAIKNDYNSFNYIGSYLKKQKNIISLYNSELGNGNNNINCYFISYNNNNLIQTAIMDRKFEIVEIDLRKISNSQYVSEILALNGLFLEKVPKFRDNNKLVDIAVSNNGIAIQFASDNLKKNIETAKKALKNTGFAYMHLHNILKNTKDIALLAVTKTGIMIDRIINKFHKDFDINLAAAKSDPHSYEFMYESIKEDRNIMEIVFNRAPEMFKYAPYKIQNSQIWVEKIIKQNSKMLFYASYEMQDNIEIQKLYSCQKIQEFFNKESAKTPFKRRFVEKIIAEEKKCNSVLCNQHVTFSFLN
jgi:hypothetical protein